MTKKSKNDIEAEKLKLEYALDHGIDFENRTIRVTGAIGGGSGGLFGGDDEYFDFNLCDFALSEMEKRSHDPITLKINSPRRS